MKRLEIIEGPHVFYVGANGRVTKGITVRSLNWVKGSGRQEVFGINDYSLSRHREQLMEEIDLTDEEYDDILRQVKQTDKDE